MRPPAIPHLRLEGRLVGEGAESIAGIDEAGRGCWAGPLYAAVAVLDRRAILDRKVLRAVTDSKLLSRSQRETLFEQILRAALAVSVASVEARLVDRLGVVAATREAMLQALDKLPLAPDAVIVDSLPLPEDAEYYGVHRSMDHADRTCLSVAAASICAKVSRDRDMVARSRRYPGYGFERNVGYGTPQHREALRALGPCPIHRRSFRPVRLALRTPPAGRVAAVAN